MEERIDDRDWSRARTDASDSSRPTSRGGARPSRPSPLATGRAIRLKALRTLSHAASDVQSAERQFRSADCCRGME